MDRYTTTLVFTRGDGTGEPLHIPVTLVVAAELSRVYLPLVLR